MDLDYASAGPSVTRAEQTDGTLSLLFVPLALLAPAGTLRHLQRVRRDNLSLEGKPDKMTQELERVLGTGWKLIVMSGKLKPVSTNML